MEPPEAEQQAAENDAQIQDGASSLTAADDEEDVGGPGMEDEWIPGQDVQIDYPRILEILVNFLAESREVFGF